MTLPWEQKCRSTTTMDPRETAQASRRSRKVGKEAAAAIPFVDFRMDVRTILDFKSAWVLAKRIRGGLNTLRRETVPTAFGTIVVASYSLARKAKFAMKSILLGCVTSWRWYTLCFPSPRMAVLGVAFALRLTQCAGDTLHHSDQQKTSCISIMCNCKRGIGEECPGLLGASPRSGICLGHLSEQATAQDRIDCSTWCCWNLNAK